MSREKNPQIFVAKLASGVREKDLDYEFRRFGPIKNVQVKRGYAFIEYEDYKDADDAIREMDGKRFEGQRIVVQQASKELFIKINYLVGKRRDRERDYRGRSRSRSRDRHYRDRSRDKDDRGYRRKGPQPEDICYNCGKTGHW